MKILHQLGHNYKWALDAHFENEVGDGFILGAYSFKSNAFGKKLSGYAATDYKDKTLIDLQYYGNKKSVGGKLDSYEFHPICNRTDITQLGGVDAVISGVQYQHQLGIKKIIVPNVYYPEDELHKSIDLLQRIHQRLSKIKRAGCSYYMTLCLSSNCISKDAYIEKLLQHATAINIDFDGYYVACEPLLEYKKKVSTNYQYYENTLKILKILGQQGFSVIYGYSNWDSLIFTSLCDIDYVTIGTYENLRNFSIKRFTESTPGGPSKGWYFSEKLLNFVKAQELDVLRRGGVLDYIANEKNIFSDVILNPSFDWNTHKPEVHKNYLLSISRLLTNLSSLPLNERANALLHQIEKARLLYEKIANEHKVYLQDESSDYHLGAWTTFIKLHQSK